LVALALPAILYGQTLAPSVLFGDSAEFQTEAWRLGVVHPTGYPLYLLSGKLFALLTPGEIAFRINLFSTFAALIALFFFFLLVHHLTQNTWLAIAGVWLGAVGSALWSQAIIAEVYALHAALFMALLYFLIQWNQHGTRHWAMAAALTMGLALAHHRTIILIAPAALLYILFSSQWRNLFRDYKILLGVMLAPLLFYLYVPWRWPVVYHRWPTGQELIDYLLARGYSHALKFSAIADGLRWQAIIDLGLQQYTWLGFILALVGMAALARRRPLELMLTGVTLLTFLFFGIIYQVPDVAVFLIPAWIIMALWLIMGVHAIFTAISPHHGHWLGAAALVLLVAFLVSTRIQQIDRSHDVTARRIADEALARPPLPGALILCDFERLSALRYAFGVERPDLHIETVMPDTDQATYELIHQALATTRPVYLARFLPGVADHFHMNSWGPLVALSLTPHTELPSTLTPTLTDIPFFDDNNAEIVRLIGFEMSEPAVRRGDPTAITLYWRATFAQPPLPYQAQIVLLDDDGNTLSSSPLAHPVANLYPLNAWTPGEIVADRRYFTIEPGIPPGVYRIAIRWQIPFQKQYLHTAANTPEAFTLLTISTNPHWRPQPEQRKKTTLCQNTRLLGFDAGGRPLPGRTLHYTFFLQRTGPGADTPLRLHLIHDEKKLATAEKPLPLAQWPENASFPFEMSLTIPMDMRADTAQLRLQCEQTEVKLQTIHMQTPPASPGEPARISFSDKMMLLSYEKEMNIDRGQVMRVTLHWWAMSPMTEDYAIFVHLLDEQGRVAWQHDGPPAFGARPTTTWTPGDVIVDVHEIPIPADAPPGNYQVEIGVYSPINWQRLNVLDAEGLPAGDHIFLSPIQITTPHH